jgi:hypothetical protein
MTLSDLTRADIETMIEALIARLDTMDPDPDLEPDVDEPSLGWIDRPMQLGGFWYPDNSDIEGDPCDQEGDISDYEPEDAESWEAPVHLLDMTGVQ